MNNSRWIIIAWVTIVLMACGRTQPQRPTFYGQTAQTDSSSLKLIVMHQTMAEQADMLLTRIADEDYVLMEENYWIKGLNEGENNLPLLQDGDYVDLSVEFYDLNGKLLSNHQSTVLLGQVDEIQAVVQVLPHLRRAMHVTMLVPWYLAFGSAGNHEIPPYENLRVEINVQ